jgi:GNAT superfamily N-acetyltransferase
MSDIEIVRAAPGDADEIARIFMASRRDALPYLPELHTDEDTHDFFARIVMRDDDVWLAKSGGEILGFVAVKPGWVDHLYLRPGHYRRGIGSLLLAKAKSLQPGGLTLWAFQKNTRARAFYESHGFKPIEFTDGAANEENEPDVRYGWSPSAANKEHHGRV